MMEIGKLKRKRQKNVQEQNELTLHGLRTEARHWRTAGVPAPLAQLLLSKGIRPDTCLFLEYEQDFPGICTDEGLVLTPDGHFYRFEMDLDQHRTQLLTLHLWEQVSAQIPVEGRRPGTGASWGFLALQVLQELNTDTGDL